MLALAFATACFAWTASGARPAWEDEPVSERYHAGHRAVHVTRLHRYDHSGMAAMLEAEEHWHSSGGQAPKRAESLVQLSGSSSAREFVQVSHRQADALQAHHDSVLQESDKLNRLRARGVRYHAQQAKDPSGIAATGLSSLDSQYVGPVGVGTVTAPMGCQPGPGASALLYVPPSEASPTSGPGANCHVTDQAQVWVVFDTGSTNIWVASDLCTHGACAYPGRSRYNHTLSSTYSPPAKETQLHIEFGTGRIDGPQGIEDFHVGPFTVYNQTFGLIQVQDGRVFDEVPFEGILGLAFPAMSANGVTPFFDNVVKQKTLGKSEFSFYFSLNSKAGNAVFWGGVDPAFHDGPIEYFKVDDPYYWSLPLVRFKIGDDVLLGEPMPGSAPAAKGPGINMPGFAGSAPGINMPGFAGAAMAGAHVPQAAAAALLQRDAGEGASQPTPKAPKAIVDTGTTFFTAEGAMFEDVIRRLPGAPCNEVSERTHPPITYTLRGHNGEPRDFVLDNTQYMTSRDSNCSPAFMRIDVPAKHGPAMVLGEVFLRHFFSVFDRGDGGDGSARVGFAKAKHGDDVGPRLATLTKHQPAFGQKNNNHARASPLAPGFAGAAAPM